MGYVSFREGSPLVVGLHSSSPERTMALLCQAAGALSIGYEILNCKGEW